MLGIVLWFNPESRIGMIWCADQGPLAYLGPDVTLPQRRARLDCGDQLVVSVEMRDGARYVGDVVSVVDGAQGADPRAIINGYHDRNSGPGPLRVVA